ncbi:MAG: lmo0937 family membrane protein [Pyrinomonadaceae bacterium]
MLWIIGAGLIVLWFILKFILHKGGFIHIFLLTGISLLIIQVAAYRKARYQRISSGR